MRHQHNTTGQVHEAKRKHSWENDRCSECLLLTLAFLAIQHLPEASLTPFVSE